MTKIDPMISASRTAPFFVKRIWAWLSGWASMKSSTRAATASFRSSVSRTPPVMDTATAVNLPSRPVSSRAMSRLVTKPPRPPWAWVIEVFWTTSITSNSVGWPSWNTLNVSPGPTSICSASSWEA